MKLDSSQYMCMCEIPLNWDNVAKYMNFKEGYQETFNKLTKKEKIRFGLGCDEFPSKYSDFDLFIYSCDQG